MATRKKPDYIGDEWFDAAPAGRSVGTQARARTGPNTDAPLEMPGDASKGAGVRSQGAAEQEGMDRAVAAASQMYSRPPPGGAPQAQATGATGASSPKQYAGDGNYLYEIRNGNELWIVGSGGKMRPPDQQRQVTSATPKGAIAYNAILAEIGGELARDGIRLSPVRVPDAPAMLDERRQIENRRAEYAYYTGDRGSRHNMEDEATYASLDPRFYGSGWERALIESGQNSGQGVSRRYAPVDPAAAAEWERNAQEEQNRRVNDYAKGRGGSFNMEREASLTGDGAFDMQADLQTPAWADTQERIYANRRR